MLVSSSVGSSDLISGTAPQKDSRRRVVESRRPISSEAVGVDSQNYFGESSPDQHNEHLEKTTENT